MKFGGNAEACFCAFTTSQIPPVNAQSLSLLTANKNSDVPVAGRFGSEINTVCSCVAICFLATVLYGCTIGRPSGVVHTTDVICSFLNLSADAGTFCVSPPRLPPTFTAILPSASGSRSGGMDLVMSRAEVLSHVWIALAPWKRSPMHARTCGERKGR